MGLTGYREPETSAGATWMGRTYRDRRDAGQQLGAALARFGPWQRPLVLGLPRGGVPVAVEVARAIGADVDTVVVRKMGAPGQDELAIGAVASGGGEVRNADIIAELGLSPAAVEAIAQRERVNVAEQERRLRGGRPFPRVAGRDVVLVDDGVATGATMRAAAQVVAAGKPARLVIAVPVGPSDAEGELQAYATDVVILERPADFGAVGEVYDDFRQVTDAEVIAATASPGD